jgi:hypothetical protein
MKLLYVNCDNSGAMEGQVLSLIEYYSELNKFSDIILLQGFKNKSEKNILFRKLCGYKSKIIWFKRWPGYTGFNYLLYYSISKKLDQLALDNETIIHLRGEMYAAIIKKYLQKKKSNAKMLVDLRGVIIEEVDRYGLYNIFQKRNKILFFEKVYREIGRNVQISVVSEAFKEYLVNQHGFQEQNICIHPNIAGKQFAFNSNFRHEIRKELGLHEGDLVVICSSKDGAAWQKDIEVIIPLMALNVKVINLSPNSLDIPGVINKQVSFNSMPGYLSAADIAILWRDDNIVNNVASPGKFSEFATMGLWVIHNGTVKIASDFIRQNNIGTIVQSVNEITEQLLSSFRNYDRTFNSKFGRETFGVEYIARSYLLQYEKILNIGK